MKEVCFFMPYTAGKVEAFFQTRSHIVVIVVNTFEWELYKVPSRAQGPTSGGWLMIGASVNFVRL